MADTIEDMERYLAAQVAWGKWNTAPLANRIAKAKWAQMTPARQFIHDAATGAFEASVLVAGWAMVLLPIMRWVLS